jgi:predicted nucleic acid-binding protein
MRFVLDSSVAFKWLVPEDDSDKADRLPAGLISGTHEAHSPDVFSIELAHSLTRAERQGRILVGQAAVLWGDAMSTPPGLHESYALTARAIEISSQVRIGVYDCLYVALAERELCDFVTADAKLIANLQHVFNFIVPLSAQP